MIMGMGKKNVNRKGAVEQPAIKKLVELGNAAGIGPLELDDPERERLNDEPDSSVICRGKRIPVEETSVWDGLTEKEQGETAKGWKLSAQLKVALEEALQAVCSGSVSVRLDRMPESKAELKSVVAIVVERVRLLRAGKRPDPLDRRTHEVEVELMGGEESVTVWLTDSVAVPGQDVLEAAIRRAIERKAGHKHASPENWLLLSDYTLAGLDPDDLDLDQLRTAVAPALAGISWTRVFLLLGSATAQPVLLELTAAPKP